MGRLVQPTRVIEVPAGAMESVGGNGAGTIRVEGDQFTERLVKYIPSEVIGAYLSLENLLDLKPLVSTSKMGVANLGNEAPTLISTHANQFASGIFALGLICTPLYIWSRSGGAGSAWVTHAFVATLAYIVWAYAMGTSFFMQSFGGSLPIYNGQLAAAGLVAFSLISGAIKPSPGGQG